MGLWHILDKCENAQNVANVQELVHYAAGKLILVRETFPDYTMHDQQHAKNVIAIVEKLLGSDIGKLDPLEAAMLILSAYFHDIGMVYHPDELAALVEEEDFQNFLDDNPAAYVQVREADRVPHDVLLEYCRTRHAERVSEHLFQLDADTLAWDGVGIAEALATLCQSHNQPLDALRLEKYTTTFFGCCDMRMCAILLRLADILDLDETRSPSAVYAHLRLAEVPDGTKAVSNIEWSKHLASRGFRFPAERTPNYSLVFLASPRHPSIENAIRKFLDVIDDEMRGCRILLDFCDPKWRSVALPGSVDRSGIVSSGYRYGEYRFVLDRHAVLRLFMGEQLYSDPYAFIRELLQNAVDACRLNLYLHDADPSTMEVRVSAWEDDSGNYWLRVDDTGCGMDQDIVENYFLGVGRSYYRSAELQAEILRKNKPRQKFVAISRFGIGVLASFIVGDRVEVSTRRRLPDGKLALPLRLSLDSLDDFFVMREQPMVPNPFPSRTLKEGGYRRSAGTSVAVRVDPTKSDVALEDLLAHARDYFFFPPVRVYINDIEQEGPRLGQLSAPLIESTICHPVSVVSRPQSIDLMAATEGLSLYAIPLNLTASSPTPALRGQLAYVTARANVPQSTSLMPSLPSKLRESLPESLISSLDNCIVSRNVFVSRNDSGYLAESDDRALTANLELRCKSPALMALRRWLRTNHVLTVPDVWHYGEQEDQVFAALFGHLIRNRDEFEKSEDGQGQTVTLTSSYTVQPDILWRDAITELMTGKWLGHNGISVSTRWEKQEEYSQKSLNLASHGVIFGAVSLFDELRPDVSVSRSALRGLSFGILSALHLSVRRAARAYLESPEADLVKGFLTDDVLSGLLLPSLNAADIEDDPLAAQWRGEHIIPFQEEYCSTEELRMLAQSAPIELQLRGPLWSSDLATDDIFLPRRPSFYQTLRLAVMELELDIEIDDPEPNRSYFRYDTNYRIRVLSADRPPRLPGLSVLPPFTAVRYRSPEILIAPGYPANLRHPVVSWFAEHAATLNADYPALFAQFKRALALVANVTPYTDISVARSRRGDEAAKLLNATLDRIRRSMMADLPSELSNKICYDRSGCLL